jgi:hypothetical protein
MGASGSTESKQQAHMSLNGGDKPSKVCTRSTDTKKEECETILSSIWIFIVMLQELCEKSRLRDVGCTFTYNYKCVEMAPLFCTSEFISMRDLIKKMNEYDHLDYEELEDLVMKIVLNLIGFVGNHTTKYKYMDFPLKYSIKPYYIFIKNNESTEAWKDKNKFNAAYKKGIYTYFECSCADE